MTAPQLLVLEGDTATATALFGGRLDVIEAALCNGEVRDREVILVAIPDFRPEGAAAVWRIAEAPDWGKFSTWIEVRDWLRQNRISEPTPAAETALSLAPAPAPPPTTAQAAAGAGPDDLTTQVSPRLGVDTQAEEPALSEPDSGVLGDSPPAWLSEVPPEPQSAPKRPMPKRRPKLGLVESDGNLARAPDPEADPLPASLSEDALAQHFIENYGENWRFVPEWGVWLHWKGDGWYRDTKFEVSSVLMRVTRDALGWREAQTLTPDGKRKINSKKTAWCARDIAAVDPRIAILAEELDRDPMILGVPGGVVDLTNGKLLDADPSQYVTRRTSIAPADGPTPLFDRVLERACADHDGMREYLLRWFGYCLTGLVTEEAFMFLHGPGGSGKSTLVKCLAEILGDYAMTISMDAFVETKGERHSQEIAKLEGARFVYASETEEGRRFKEGLIQLLTGGDKIVAHRMRMDDREYKPTFKILIYANAVPHLKGASEAMRRRIHLIEYAGSLTDDERDSTLKARLVAEYPAILATLIRGCVDWQDCAGLGKPDSVTASVDDYLQGEDGFATFLDECILADANGSERSGEVYRRYRSWAAAAGEYCMAQKRFVQQMRIRGFDGKRTAAGRQIIGLKLRAQQQDYPPPHQSERD